MITAKIEQEDLSKICSIEEVEKAKENLEQKDYQDLLEKCKKYYEKEITEIEKDVNKTEQEKKTLSNEIYALKKKIRSLDYQINQNNIIINDLTVQIQDTQSSIEKTYLDIEKSKEKLANILRIIYEEDQRSLIEILFKEEKFSDFYDNLVALEVLNNENKEILKNIKDLKSYLETQENSLSQEKNEIKKVVVVQELKKEENAKAKKNQEYFLSITEKEYEKHIKEKKQAQEKVVQIEKLLFRLLETPEGGIEFKDAVEIAKKTSAQTGIRPAFALAILWQETKIGKYLGSCYLKDPKTGNGVYIKTGNKALRTMKPSRDVKPFLSIIDELNKAGKLKTNAFSTPVSCCMYKNGKPYGYGGAMGPAQFIASTWVNEVKDGIEKITGDIPANPWNIRDAFLANGLYLKSLGAGAKTYDKEIYAALRYFGCTSSWCRTNYGEPVMSAAECCQQYIDKGSMSAKCQDLIF